MQLFIIAIGIFLLDQVTKFEAIRELSNRASVPVIQDIFHLTFVQNRGIAFGLLENYGTVLLVVIALCVAGLIIYFAFAPESDRFQRICYGFILGGAIGNLCDRIRLGYVVDFLDFRIWPVFNIADTFITIGVSLLILMTFRKVKHAS